MATKRIKKKANNLENPQAMTRGEIEKLEGKLFPVSAENLPNMVTHSGTVSGQKELSPKIARQKQFLQAYRANGFNVSRACEAINIGRRTFYNWKNDADFREDLKIVEDELKDYLKSKLFELVDQGNLIACIFANKTLGQLVETTRQDIRINEPLELSKEHADKVVRAGIQSMLDRPKYHKMLGLDPEPEPDEP